MATILGLQELIAGKSAVVIGPGIGASDDSAQIVEWMIRNGAQPDRPLLIDADGLNVVATLGPAILKSAQGPTVLTPHPGEMARLLGSSTVAVNSDRIGAARQLAVNYRSVVLLKGARSVSRRHRAQSTSIPVGIRVWVRRAWAMSSRVSLARLLGQRTEAGDALRLGVFLHGYAADRLAVRIGPSGFFASEVADELPPAIAALLH